MNLKKIKDNLKSHLSDSDKFEQAAMNVLVKGKSFINGHNVTKEANKLFVDGKEAATIPEELPKAINVLLKELKKLDDKITDSQVTDAFENIKKHFGGAKQFSFEELKKSGYNKMDDGKYVGLQLYSPWAKANIEKVVNTLYDQFSKQHNYNTSPKNTKKWIQEMVENNIEANPEGAFLIQFGVIDDWVNKLKELVTSQIQVHHLDQDTDPANRGNKNLE